jgi:hypothetical protein
VANISWELKNTGLYTCPCGKGEYEIETYSDDWSRTEERLEMLCPQCANLYVYDNTVLAGHPGDETLRGWVLKSVIEEEQKHKADLEAKAKQLYLGLWESKFIWLKTKKDIWRVLSHNGKYYPSLGTFYAHTKGYSVERLTKYINGSFNYYELKKVFEVCGIEPDWEFIGANKSEIKRFRPELPKALEENR